MIYDESWLNDARCRGKNTDFFYPDFDPDDPSDIGSMYELPRAFCRGCPVRAVCLYVGMYETDGMWGGLTPSARKAVRQPRSTTAPPLVRKEQKRYCKHCGGSFYTSNHSMKYCEYRCKKAAARARGMTA